MVGMQLRWVHYTGTLPNCSIQKQDEPRLGKVLRHFRSQLMRCDDPHRGIVAIDVGERAGGLNSDGIIRAESIAVADDQNVGHLAAPGLVENRSVMGAQFEV